MLFCGPTGIGKSSLAMQCAILWALGGECFGIRPARPLKSLLIQAENDDGDMAEMRDGVIRGLGLSKAEATAACERILVVQEDSRTSSVLCDEVIRPLLEQHRPDLLWIDPALAYLGGEASTQRDVTTFLRTYLNPLVHEFKCGVVIVHHANKPSKGPQNWIGSDHAYLGSGSIEWANWARCIITLRECGSDTVFELRAAKRGRRLGWTNADGSIRLTKTIAHAKEQGAIYWREPEPQETKAAEGRPKLAVADEILALLPPDGLTAGEWEKAALLNCGVKERTFHRRRRELADLGRVQNVAGKWRPMPEVSKVPNAGSDT